MAKAISRRERVFLAVGVTALLLFFFGRFYLVKAVEFQARARKQIPEKTKVLTAYRAAVGREAGLEAEAAALAAELKSYERALLPSAAPPLAAADLQTRLKELADRAGLKIQSEKILAHVRRQAYTEIPVQIVAGGEIRNLRDFIVAVDRSEVFIAVQDLTLRSVKRRQFVPESRSYLDVSEIQASITLVGLIPG